MKSAQNSRFSQSFQENERAGYRPFPEEFPIYLTHNEFPSSAKVSSEMEMPLGMVARPLADINYANISRTIGNLSKNVKEIARCVHCGAYINPYCEANSSRWYCSVCGKRNAYSKAQIRYKSVDHKLIPELRELVIDYNAPIASTNGEVESISAEQRPLIHVFLVQENMKIDTLQTTIDSLLQSLDSLHPDIHVMLITFSHRIGIFNLNSCVNSIPVVQYSHFLTDNNQIYENSDEMMNSLAVDQFRLSLPLTEIGSFLHCSSRIADCRENLENALSSILEALPSNDNTDERNDIRTLLPVLQAINGWLNDEMENMQSKNDLPMTSLVPEPPTIFNTFDFSKLWQFLPTSDTEKKEVSALHNFTNQYHGIRVHIFIDTPQYPLFTTDNSSKDVTQALQRAMLFLIHQFNEKFVTCNIYSVCSFETNQTDLWNWLYLLTSLAGECYRITLGHSELLEMEKFRFIEILQRQFATLYANKVALKLRIPRALQLISTTIPTPVDVNQLSTVTAQSKAVTGDSEAIKGNYVTPATAATTIMQQKFTDDTTTNIPMVENDRVYHFPMITSDTCFGFRFKFREHLKPEDLESSEYEMHYGKGNMSSKYRRQNVKPTGDINGIYLQIACVYEQLIEVSDEKDSSDDMMNRSQDEAMFSCSEKSPEEEIDYLVHTCKSIKYPIVDHVATAVTAAESIIRSQSTNDVATAFSPSDSITPTDGKKITGEESDPVTVQTKSNKIAESHPIAMVMASEDPMDTTNAAPMLIPANEEATSTTTTAKPKMEQANPPSISTTSKELSGRTTEPRIPAVLVDIAKESIWKELKKQKPTLSSHVHSYYHPSHRLQPAHFRHACMYTKSKKLIVKKFIRILTVGIDCTTQLIRLQQVQQYTNIAALLLQEATLAAAYGSFYASTSGIVTSLPPTTTTTNEESVVTPPTPTNNTSDTLLHLLSIIQEECIHGPLLLTLLVHYLQQHYQYYLQSYQQHHPTANSPASPSVSSPTAHPYDDYEEYLPQDEYDMTMPSPTTASKTILFDYILTHHKHTQLVVEYFFAMILKLLPTKLLLDNHHKHGKTTTQTILPQHANFVDAQVEWMTKMRTSNPMLIARQLSPALYTITMPTSGGEMMSGPQDTMNNIPMITSSISLRRDQMIMSTCTQFLLDTGTEVVYYAQQPWSLSMGTGNTKSTDEPSSGSMKEMTEEEDRLGMLTTASAKRRNSRTSSTPLPKLLPVLHARLYEQPIVPRVYHAQAGTLSATYFTSHFVDDPMNTLISYPEFLQLLADMIIP